MHPIGPAVGSVCGGTVRDTANEVTSAAAAAAAPPYGAPSGTTPSDPGAAPSILTAPSGTFGSGGPIASRR